MGAFVTALGLCACLCMVLVACGHVGPLVPPEGPEPPMPTELPR